MKCIINISEHELYVVKVPEQYKNFVIEQFGRMGTWLKETDSKGLNHWKINIPKGRYEVLGFAKDIFLEDYDNEKYDNFILKIINK